MLKMGISGTFACAVYSPYSYATLLPSQKKEQSVFLLEFLCARSTEANQTRSWPLLAQQRSSPCTASTPCRPPPGSAMADETGREREEHGRTVHSFRLAEPRDGPDLFFGVW